VITESFVSTRTSCRSFALKNFIKRKTAEVAYITNTTQHNSDTRKTRHVHNVLVSGHDPTSPIDVPTHTSVA